MVCFSGIISSERNFSGVFMFQQISQWALNKVSTRVRHFRLQAWSLSHASEITQFIATRVFFPLLFSLMTNWAQIFTGLLFNAYVGIHQVRILVFDNYPKYTLPLSYCMNNWWMWTIIEILREKTSLSTNDYHNEWQCFEAVWCTSPFQYHSGEIHPQPCGSTSFVNRTRTWPKPWSYPPYFSLCSVPYFGVWRTQCLCIHFGPQKWRAG